MKKLLVIIFILLFSATTSSYAITTTPTPLKKVTPTGTPEVTKEQEDIDRIEKIKDLVASKVAELKLVEKRGILGVVKSTTNTQIILEDIKKRQRVIDIDELTKFKSTGKESFGISDIKEGDMLSFVGLYNKDSKRLLARFVSRDVSPVNIEGIVALKDGENFTITIVSEEGSKKIIDIQTSTKTTSYDGENSKRSGFSKIERGQRAIVVGFADLKKKGTINAQRVIHFTDLPPSSGMRKFVDFVDEDAPVSTGSGKKLQPIIKQ